jgi:hypothetical protein
MGWAIWIRGDGGHRPPIMGPARLATSGGCPVLLTGERRVSGFRGAAVQFNSLRGREQGSGLDTGNGAALREGGGDVIGSDGVGKFGNGQDVETASSEERGAEFTAKIFDRDANGREAIVWGLQNPGPGGGSETNVMAEESHEASQHSGGRDFGGLNRVRRREGEVKSKSRAN